MIKKSINFQCNDAYVASWIKFAQPTTFIAISGVAKILGGAWVGGSCELSHDKIKILKYS